MATGDDNTLVFRGASRSILYAVQGNGETPAREFLEQLERSDQAKLMALFVRLANSGSINNKEKFKLVEKKIFEFKSFQIRIGCFQERTNWFLTHGFIKKADAWPRRELNRALRIREEHLARINRGS